MYFSKWHTEDQIFKFAYLEERKLKYRNMFIYMKKNLSFRNIYDIFTIQRVFIFIFLI